MAVAALGGCKKEGSSSSPVAALLPASTADKLPGGLLAFADELPADLDAFGYADVGMTLDQLTADKRMLGTYRTLYEDLAAMTQRRWGIDVRKLSGVGFVVHQHEPLLVAAVPSKPLVAQGGEQIEDVMLGQLGKLTVLGEPKAVAGLLAAAKQGKRLYQENPAWMRSAMTRAAGNSAFVSVSVQPLLSSAPANAKAMLGDVLASTVAVGSSGVVLAVMCKPNTVGKVRLMVEQGLAMAKEMVEAKGQNLPAEPPGPLFGVLLRHYSAAFFKSLEQKVNGDELSMTLGWHAPSFPAMQPVALAERVVAPGEVAVAQVNLGAPVLDLALALTDVLKSPLDRAALKKELAAELAKLAGVPGLDPRAVTISVGPQGSFFVSLHNAPVGAPLTPLPLFGGAVDAVATPWGLALNPVPAQGGQVLAAAGQPEPGLPLSGVKLLDAKDVYFRGYVDLTKLPQELMAEAAKDLHAVLGELRSVAMVSTDSHMALDVTTSPGKAKEVAKELEGLIGQMVPPEIEEMYKNRAKVSTVEELMAVVQHYQRDILKQYLTPKSVQSDKLSFAADMEPAQMQMMTAVALVGVAAAVAIPAFMSYSMRSRDLDYPIPQDPDLSPAADWKDPQGVPGGAGGVDVQGLPGGQGLSAEEIEKLQKEMEKMQKEMEAELKKAGVPTEPTPSEAAPEAPAEAPAAPPAAPPKSKSRSKSRS